jgi:hypothetical protein
MSPRYTSKDACEYYVEREELADMEEAIDELLRSGPSDKVSQLEKEERSSSLHDEVSRKTR